MKRLSLAFKKFICYKLFYKKILHLTLLQFCISCLPILESFKFSAQNSLQSPQSQIKEDYISIPTHLKTEQKPLIKIASKTCFNHNIHEALVEFKSPFALHKLIIKKNFSLNKVSLKIERPPLFLESFEDFLDPEVVNYLCHKKSRKHFLSTQKKQLEIQIKKWLSQISPDCSFNFDPRKGWQCELRAHKKLNTKKTLSKLKNHILRKWKRQPYILARRLILSQKLLKIETASDKKSALSNFCDLLENSSQNELPFAIQAIDWREKLCSSKLKKEELSETINYILYYSLLELKRLKYIGTKMASKGQIYFRLPRKKRYSKEVWVQLKATPNLQKKLATFALSLNKKKLLSTASLLQKETKACWHPLFGSKPENLALIEILGLRESKESNCQKKSLSPNLLQKSGHYLAKSISGENAFLVSQGYYKILRLPKGEYEYQIFQLLQGARRWQPSLEKPIASGLLKWKGRRTSLALHDTSQIPH